MRTWIKVVGLSCGICFALVRMQAQTPTAPSQSKEKTEQIMEDAHRGLFQAPPNTATQAGQVTKQVAAGLPRDGSGQSITRKNLVDEHIFGRMDRDGIPHS